MGIPKDELVNDAKFILSECSRIKNSLQTSGFRDIPPKDRMACLPHPRGHGDLLCGVMAAEIITKFAREATQRGMLGKRVSIEYVRKETASIFVSRFIKESRLVETKQLDRMFNAIIFSAKKYRKDITHLIPCHLMLSKKPEKFSIGPVTFHNRSSIARLVLDKRVLKPLPPNPKYNSRTLLARTIKFYRKFRWVAEVTINDCDDRVSTKIANDAVTAALNCLHLLLGADNSRRMRVGGMDISHDRRATLTIDSNGFMKPSTSFAYLGEVIYGEDWYEMLSKPHMVYFIKLYSIALEVTVDPDLNRPISRRFIDAIQWYGEAVRDSSLSTKTVKFITCLERMLMTDEREDIASVIAQRLAALCFSEECSRSEWFEKTKKIYDLRSRLVHGSISPSSPEIESGADVAEKISELALNRIVEALGADGLREASFSTAKFARWFKGYLIWANAEEKAMHTYMELNSNIPFHDD
jgi:hypothetical protein